MEVPAPIITPAALHFNLANEGGVAGRTCLLRNVTGLWLVQEIRRATARDGHALSYAELTDLARQATPFAAVIDPDHPNFIRPDDMPAAIRATCRATGQPAPDDLGQLVRIALEGLALRYRWTLDGLERVTGRAARVVHVVGGGARNGLLCQMTAEATGRPVLAGPVEATAVGNVLVQAMAAGRLDSIEQGRELVARSFPVEVYEPGPRASWDAAYARFLRLSP
jgi:rhamnulokinase